MKKKKKTDLISLGQAHIDNVLGLDTVQHSRTKGSKNGVRLYQFLNGTWTELGKLRRRKGMAASDHKGTSNDSTPLKKVNETNTQNKSVATNTKTTTKIPWKDDEETFDLECLDLHDMVTENRQRGSNTATTRLQIDPNSKSMSSYTIHYTDNEDHDWSVTRNSMLFLRDRYDTNIDKSVIDKAISKVPEINGKFSSKDAQLMGIQMYTDRGEFSSKWADSKNDMVYEITSSIHYDRPPKVNIFKH